MAPSGVFDIDNDPPGAAAREETDAASPYDYDYDAVAAASTASPAPDTTDVARGKVATNSASSGPPPPDEIEIVDPSALTQEERRAAICDYLSSRTNETGRINKGVAEVAAERFGTSKSGVSNIWRRHKLAIMHPENFKLDFGRKKGSGRKRKYPVDEILERIKRVKVPYRQSLRSLADKTGVPKSTLCRALKQNGLNTYARLTQTGNDTKESETASSTAHETNSEIPVPPVPHPYLTAEVQNLKSKIVTSGSLRGVIYPSSPNAPEKKLPSCTKETTYEVTVPETVLRPSDGSTTMSCAINDGANKQIKIPRGLKRNDTFTFTHTDLATDKVVTSTMSSVPGMDVVQFKPVIWTSVSSAFIKGSADRHATTGTVVEKLKQEAQEKMLEQVVEHECNACLGMTFNVTTDSSGKSRNHKLVIVTAHGTPCVVVSTSTASSNDDDAGKPHPFG
eukprot:CAMPEP_0201681714 /NCGR_PEP_ID=MMETSP0494-20130426/51254_1 /ASSEMBLY_ACC=CAM_ASM_000839 /TAXON_ID=420259 /ORGANISM="Thalassiosira gravida, Strain GMp14c1" /LENGTH=450 /DNA_ID=CAMNT_0048165467 /DNA_START=14 /DNA_END=1366 /DNA_ORIENTATION=+